MSAGLPSLKKYNKILNWTGLDIKNTEEGSRVI